jgi:hypothetical protein
MTDGDSYFTQMTEYVSLDDNGKSVYEKVPQFEESLSFKNIF